MEHEIMHVKGRQVEGYVIPLQSCNLTFIKSESGILACGAIDVSALDKFEIPAARISGVTTLDDLMKGSIKEVNSCAAERGVKTGMNGEEALEFL